MTTADIEELFSKLKPIYGNEKVDRLWLSYLAEDTDGRKEIETTLRMLCVKHLSKTPGKSPLLLPPPPANIVKGEYPVGDVLYNKKVVAQFGLREDEWIQHMGIFGRSGAGKTNLVFKLLNNFLEKGRKFAVPQDRRIAIAVSQGRSADQAFNRPSLGAGEQIKQR